MKECKFKVGDKVRCTNLNEDIPVAFNGGVQAYWTKMAGFKVGDTANVIEVTGLGNIVTDKSKLIVNTGHFELAPKALIIVLRRNADRKSIMKVLTDAGYPMDIPGRSTSRIIFVPLVGVFSGKSYIDGQALWGDSVKACINIKYAHAREHFGFDPDEMVVIKTKPSVSKAINQISKYL